MGTPNKSQVALKSIIDFIVDNFNRVDVILEDKKVSFGESLELMTRAFQLPKIVKAIIDLDYDTLQEDIKAMNDLYPDTNIDEIAAHLLEIIVNIKAIAQITKK